MTIALRSARETEAEEIAAEQRLSAQTAAEEAILGAEDSDASGERPEATDEELSVVPLQVLLAETSPQNAARGSRTVILSLSRSTNSTWQTRSGFRRAGRCRAQIRSPVSGQETITGRYQSAASTLPWKGL